MNMRYQSTMFQLNHTLNSDCTTIGEFKLSLLLLMNDANYPWFIMVPQRAELSEIYQLNESEQQQLTRESSQLASALSNTFNADKINIAALGNVVRQLHIHHIVRYHDDPAWPAPVWGAHPATPYCEDKKANIIKQLVDALGNDFTPSYTHG